MPRRLRQNIPFLADVTDERHHHLFANGIDRRIGDLGEKLFEVIKKRLRFVRQAGERGIGSHRTKRFLAVDRHRRHQEAHVFIGVPEGALAHHDGGVIGAVYARRLAEVFERDLVAGQPVGIAVPGRQLVLDLTIGNDAALFQIHQEHLARLQAAFHLYVFRLDRQYPGLGRHHHEVVVRDEITRRTQAVAVERGPDQTPVRERNRGGAVPGLHQRAVIFVVGFARRIHVRIAVPCLGNQHRHRVRQRAAGLDEKLERVIEGRRIAPAGLNNREELRKVRAEQVGLENGLARMHPAHIAPDRIDFAIVGNVMERMRKLPGGKCVRREALVHQAKRAGHIRIGKLYVEFRNLRREQQTFVNDRAARERRHREHPAVGHLTQVDRGHFRLGALANDVEFAFKPVGIHPRAAAHENLLDVRLRCARDAADRAAVDRGVPPSQNA